MEHSLAVPKNPNLILRKNTEAERGLPKPLTPVWAPFGSRIAIAYLNTWGPSAPRLSTHSLTNAVEYLLYFRCVALKDDCHKKRADMLAYHPMEVQQLEFLAKTCIITPRENLFIQNNSFNIDPNYHCIECKLCHH